MIYTLSFVCSTPYAIPSSEVDVILKAISYKNKIKGVNGFLIYSQGNIFKVLEGEKEIVEGIFESYKKNALFANLIIIFEQPLKKIKNHEPAFHSINHKSVIDIDKLTRNLMNRNSCLLNVIKEVLKAFNKRILNKNEKHLFLND
ncbi:BLUF domain-containing protein [Antarcticibacterium arcticum]|nr:BLUF domain-containing protein [Antarcticibacterium arcticum]